MLGSNLYEMLSISLSERQGTKTTVPGLCVHGGGQPAEWIEDGHKKMVTKRKR